MSENQSSVIVRYSLKLDSLLHFSTERNDKLEKLMDERHLSEDLTTSSTQQVFLASRNGSSSMEPRPKKRPPLVVNIRIMLNLDTDM